MINSRWWDRKWNLEILNFESGDFYTVRFAIYDFLFIRTLWFEVFEFDLDDEGAIFAFDIMSEDSNSLAVTDFINKSKYFGKKKKAYVQKWLVKMVMRFSFLELVGIIKYSKRRSSKS